MARTQTSTVAALLAPSSETGILLHPALNRYATALQASDLVTVPICGAFIYYFKNLSATSRPSIIIFILGTTLVLAMMKIGKCYDAKFLGAIFSQLWRVLISWVLAIIIMILFSFLVAGGDSLPLAWMVSWLAFGVSVATIIHCAIAVHFNRLRRSGLLSLNLAVVGSPAFGEFILKQITESDGQRLGVRLLGVFAFGAAERHAGDPKAGNTAEDLAQLARTTRVDEVVVQMRNTRDPDFQSLLKKLSEIPCRVSLSPDLSDIPRLSELSGARSRGKGRHSRFQELFGLPCL
jgi:FlaA1/EpsC-like NDP-sugar epimerase